MIEAAGRALQSVRICSLLFQNKVRLDVRYVERCTIYTNHYLYVRVTQVLLFQ